MTARSPHEPHRVSTPLELFFDLVFVVAIAQAASGLHHAIAEDHAVQGLMGYLMVFFAIWWAWMNFSWFASAYDCDDLPYRLTVFVQITGALSLAAGITQLFEHRVPNVAVLGGYVVMRLAMVVQWLRAGAGDPGSSDHRAAVCHRDLGPAGRVGVDAGGAAALGAGVSLPGRAASCSFRCGPSRRSRPRGTRITSASATAC